MTTNLTNNPGGPEKPSPLQVDSYTMERFQLYMHRVGEHSLSRTIGTLTRMLSGFLEFFDEGKLGVHERDGIVKLTELPIRSSAGSIVELLRLPQGTSLDIVTK